MFYLGFSFEHLSKIKISRRTSWLNITSFLQFLDHFEVVYLNLSCFVHVKTIAKVFLFLSLFIACRTVIAINVVKSSANIWLHLIVFLPFFIRINVIFAGKYFNIFNLACILFFHIKRSCWIALCKCFSNLNTFFAKVLFLWEKCVK